MLCLSARLPKIASSPGARRLRCLCLDVLWFRYRFAQPFLTAVLGMDCLGQCRLILGIIIHLWTPGGVSISTRAQLCPLFTAFQSVYLSEMPSDFSCFLPQ